MKNNKSKNSKFIEEIKIKLLQDIGEKRFAHSIRVARTAVDLGKKYYLDEEKVFLAGLLHDCGRLENSENILINADEFGIILDDIASGNPALIHAALGGEIAKLEYGIEDTEILDAIKYHTCGRENMTLLEKIVFIADYIEPAREFKGIEEIRRLAHYDLDASIVMAIEASIEYLSQGEVTIHPQTIKALNYLKTERMKRGEKNIE